MPEAEFDIDKMLDEEQNDWGFHWPLDALNQSMRPSRPGDFGILAARVDQGKSSFIAHTLSHFAPQVDKLFPGEDRSIIVLNNEGLGSRLNQRLTQATLNMNMDELAAARQENRNLWNEVLDAWGGRRVVTVYDVHDRPMSYLENIIRRTNPAVI
ncbi:AAA family ATPase, partial [Escherichia coli]|uniref:AAA family ATPase n=1 Tax=Escherichia coli TaxID=562 RepID=UPI00215AA5C1